MKKSIFGLLLCVLAIVSMGCTATPQKAMNYGMAMTKIYESVDSEARRIRDKISPQDAVRLADAMIIAGEAIRAYNFVVMSWYVTKEKPADYEAIYGQLQKAFVELYGIYKDVRAVYLTK